MTRREELKGEGFHFFCFSKPEAREEYRTRSAPAEEFATECVDETFTSKKFEVFFLAVKKLHHVPVVYTPVGGLL